jgi:ribose/xylose/arabinose/galactoside ABC-type transport system permease subunit
VDELVGHGIVGHFIFGLGGGSSISTLRSSSMISRACRWMISIVSTVFGTVNGGCGSASKLAPFILTSIFLIFMLSLPFVMSEANSINEPFGFASAKERKRA